MLLKKVWNAPLATTKGFWYDYWVKWVHQVDGIVHCFTCLQLDGCYFTFINIMIEIPRRNGIGTVTFTSGWMVEADGKIKLNTPFGGK